jgi:hypothetical protein
MAPANISKQQPQDAWLWRFAAAIAAISAPGRAPAPADIEANSAREISILQRVPLEVNRRVGKGAIKLACHSNDWSARSFAHPTNVIQFHRDLL